MPRLSALIAIAVVSFVLTACSGTEQGSAPAALPDYDIVGRQDVSIGVVKRFQVKVSLPQHYARGTVEDIAKAVAADITRSQAVNAVSILFYGPGTSTAGIYDVAMVEWAPNGSWADATSVRAGDYSSFRYSVTYNASTPADSSKAGSLRLSGKTGLLGVPLPEGASLVERNPGDAAAGRDPSERYSISASPEEIVAFFSKAMREAGWTKDGSSTDYSLLFDKGNLMIGILINRNGKMFMLMGS